MRKLYIYLFLTSCFPAFHSCTHTEPGQVEKEEIILSSKVETSLVAGTRAVGNFPNDGTIGIFAATEYDPANPQYTNWRAYSDLNNAEATAVSVSSGVYSFAWSQTKYWPFDGSNLYFVSYSPYTTATADPNYYLPDNGTILYIGLNGNIPDVMYATGNLNPQPYNKTSGTVDLGEFRHALSQLTIEIIAEDGMPSSIHATELTVTTEAISGTFNFLDGDDGMDVTINSASPVSISLVSGSVDFSQQSISRSQLLFADTQDYTQISISLFDTATNSLFSRSYNISSFTNDNPNQPITLQRGKNTILRFLVQVVDVENPEATIQLQGIITDWNDQGQYGVNIE